MAKPQPDPTERLNQLAETAHMDRLFDLLDQLTERLPGSTRQKEVGLLRGAVIQAVLGKPERELSGTWRKRRVQQRRAKAQSAE